MKLSIVINNYKTRGLLRQCLKGIFGCPPKCEFEVIVVDNDSRDGSAELVRDEFPQVKLLDFAENLGFHKGNNAGIKVSTGEYILILNTDIAILDDSLDKMMAFMDSHGEAALAGAKLKNPDGSIQMSCMRYPTAFIPLYRRTFLGDLPFAKRQIDNYLMTDFDHSETREVDWILGACIMVRRAAIDKVGMMDEELFLYCGDMAWAKNFEKAGYKVYYFADTNIVHYHKRESASSGIFSKIFWIHIIDWIKYLRKYS